MRERERERESEEREERERERERECYSVFFALVHTQGVHTQGIETGLMRACHAARRNKNGHTAYVHGAGTPHLQWGRGNPPSPGELVSTAVSTHQGHDHSSTPLQQPASAHCSDARTSPRALTGWRPSTVPLPLYPMGRTRSSVLYWSRTR